MKQAVRIAFLLVVLLMIFLGVDGIRAGFAPGKARGVRIGDSREQVRSKLGRPSAVTQAGIFNCSETWAYGGYLDWQHLTSCGLPIRLRIFGPEADEVAIRFDDEGKVSKVIIPKPDGK